MKLIPVIDLMQGQVVRAVRGDRHAYRPIVSTLCGTSEPLDVARILCTHCATDQLYVADLDALLGQPAQVLVVRRLLEALPRLELWLDAGFDQASSAEHLLAALGTFGTRVVPVFGSESLASRAELERCFGPTAGSAAKERVLSLDRRDGQRLDAAGCWDAADLWPPRVIVMTLERVGADAGPDLDTLAEVKAKSPSTRLIGAGGIRNAEDLARAGAAGAEAWLVASALHDGRLPAVRPA
ncbi:MAG: HisA/HisF-related TIM barrel protein [Caldimonas sp.]